MQFRIERINPHSGQIKVIRLATPGVQASHFKPAVREPVLAIRSASEPLKPPHIAPLSPRAAEDRSPEARAHRATRRLRQQFEKARRAAKGQARLCRADEYE
jgi:hypothetical protein